MLTKRARSDFPGAKQPAPVENWTTHWKHLDHELQAGKKAPQHPQKKLQKPFQLQKTFLHV